ncbi:MAG: TonB-dependent receptor [Bacteroidota bacterium]
MKRVLIHNLLLLIICLFMGQYVSAQGTTQTLRGTIIDKQSETPLVGATVIVVSQNPPLGSTTQADGTFVIRNVPIGRQIIQVKYLGYETVTIPNVLVNAGKEVILDVGLEESIIQAEEVVISGKVNKDRAQNDLATVSSRTFSLEEVRRYAGGSNDVARLAGNFAGVSTANDSRNDIVIRGNSPTGVLWRLEGVPIPNPNHFSTLGTTGGPVSGINPNILKNSDFLTSAFPAEYGNATGGVFDLGFRNGNKETHEFTAQLNAFSGLELMAEGPIKKENKSNFVAAYRYSFVEIGDALGIPIGTNAVPNYQDLSFNVDLGNSKAGRFSIFGIGGLSDIAFLADEIDEDDLFANPNEDAFAESRFGVIGVRHNILLNQNAYLRTVVSASTSQNDFNQDNFLDTGEKFRATESSDVVNTLTLSSYINQKFNARTTLRAGILIESNAVDTDVRDRDNRPDLNGDGIPDWVQVRDLEETLTLYQAYAQIKHKLSEKFTLNLGVHSQYLDFNESFALEPRVAVNWDFLPQHRLSLAYGIHNQAQPYPVLLFREEVEPGLFRNTNEDLDFTRASHFVLGYDYRPGGEWRVKAEAYYQMLDQVPIEAIPSSFSVLNSGSDFVFPDRGSLVNEGTGRNYGLELTVEKFFSRGYYGLLTASVYDSEYEGSDEISRNTAFNNQYVLNVLGGKEWKVGKAQRNAFTLDFKVTNAGGRYYTPVDLAATRANFGREVLDEENAFSERFDPYFRMDVKFGFRVNSKKKKLSQQFYIDLQNVTNQENIFVRRYNEVTDEINEVNQRGFFPDLLYRIQF